MLDSGALEHGLHCGKREAAIAQRLDQLLQGRKAMAVAARTPVLEAEDHFEPVAQIGQLQRCHAAPSPSIHHGTCSSGAC